jgi:hypothetical protein
LYLRLSYLVPLTTVDASVMNVNMAESRGRRNASILRSCDGTSTRLDDGSDGKAADAVTGATAGCPA